MFQTKLVILRCIHFVLGLVEFAKRILDGFYRFVDYADNKRQPVTVLKLKADARNLCKVPMHVGMVLVERELWLNDLADMVVWSVLMGASCVSLYDLQGTLKQKNEELQEALERSQMSTMGAGHISLEIQIVTHGACCTEKPAVAQGTKKAEVHLLSKEDGRQIVLQVAYTFNQKVLAQEISATDMSPAFISNTIYETYPFPNPDLVLIFGSPPSLTGYLPWQMRQAEIICLPTHRGLGYQRFYSSLQLYQGTYQGSYQLPVLRKLHKH